MAFEQGYYQAPRRLYTEQDASQATPRQTYGPPAQQYDQYQDDNYGNGYEDGYNEEGYPQDYGQPSRNGYGGWRENDYPLRQEYSHPPPQQGYYGDMREGWMSSQRETPPMQRSTIGEGMRAGYEQRSGPRVGGSYPSSGAASRGSTRHPRAKANPNHLGPRGQTPRKPLKTPPISPDQPAWDNPFPTFPGTKKKTSISEELEISQKMANMDVGPQPKVKGGPKQARAPLMDEIHRTTLTESQRRGPPPEDYVRPALDQRSTSSRGYPLQGSPQSGYREPRNPSLGSGQGTMSQSGYSDIDYSDRRYGQGSSESWARDSNGTSGRSMTMTNEKSIPTSRTPLQISADDVGPSAPYNGPVGRALPPRPATASGHRLAPQRSFQLPPMSTYPIDGGVPVGHMKNGSMVDFYEDGGADDPLTSQSRGMEMPDFEVALNKPHKRGSSFDQHIRDLPQQHNYGKLKAMKSQPNIRGQGQAQSAVFETAEAAPPMPKGPIQGYVNGYGQDPYQGTYNRGTVREPAPMEYGGYNEVPVNGFQLPPRSASVAPPRSAYRGFPNGPPRQISDGILPSYPQPVRAGFISNSVAGLPNNKPTPVRNYDNITPAQMVSQSTGEVSAPESVPDSNPVTPEELELLRNKIKINPNDQTSQMLLARRLVEASEVLVQSIPDQRARNKAREKYVIDAHKVLKKLVLAQNTEAMFYLADCYGRGALGLETDNKEAFSLYQSAAKAGHAAAAYRTAVCCELGNEEGGGTRKDPLKAIQWYKRAAMLGDTPAMYKMGIVQLKGLLGQPRNPREAVGWLKRAADRADAENPHALHELALLYEQPQGLENTVVRDEAYSFQLFCQAAELGYKFSQFRLGCAYEYGLFHCPTDPRQSIMWYSRAAAQEEHQSELALSGWYLTGSEGVLQQSDTEAYLWARKAAMAGLAKAEYAMGYFTEVGIGAPANLEDAKRWYWRAAAQNFPKARERLEDLKRGGSKIGTNSRKHISRSKVGKQNEGECLLM